MKITNGRANFQEYTKSFMSTIMKYAYTGQIPMTIASVTDIVNFGLRFRLRDLVNEARMWMAESITSANAIKIYELSKKLGVCQHVNKKLMDFIVQHIKEVLKESWDDILKLTEEDLKAFFRHDELNMTEEELFETIINLIKNGIGSHHLLKRVRYSWMDKEYFNKNVVDNLFQWMVDQSCRSTENKSPRINNIIFALGGWRKEPGGPTADIEVIHPKSGGKQFTINLPNSRAYHGIGALDKKIYFFGGYDGLEYHKQSYVWDPTRSSFEDIAPLNIGRCYTASAVQSGLLYAIGGLTNPGDRVSTVETYNPSTNVWTMIAPMIHVRSDAAACASNGKIYAIGGFDGHGIHSSTEIYRPMTDTWSPGPNLAQARSGVKAVSCKGKIYVIGGFDGFNRLNTMECLDTNKPYATWVPMASMNMQRSNFGVTVVDDTTIIVAGGYDGESVTGSVEAYDIKKNVWKQLDGLMAEKSALALVTINGLINGADYFKGQK